ncbi:MAG: CRISPR-associated helicase Cas3' [Phycisphaerae bacterium]
MLRLVLQGSSAQLAYAHTRPGTGPEGWEPYEAHAAGVARLAEDFAAAFGAGSWGRVLGRFHDLGKLSAAFQRYLHASSGLVGGPDEPEADGGAEAVPAAGSEVGAAGLPGRVDHSSFGARHAVGLYPKAAGQILAFCIAGHHAGLADATSASADGRSTLQARLAKPTESVVVPPEDQAGPELRVPFAAPAGGVGFATAFFTRMLFSCLVDADRVATEAFCDPTRAAERAAAKPTVGQLAGALSASLAELGRDAEPTAVNRVRAGVLAECLAAAELPPGFFSLNVPTGGGKTFSSLAFALRHAQKHGQRRVVMAVPFTSIIEQTADAYRRALGPLAELGLVEHHSNIEPKRQTLANRLAAENWDAPLIVTTNVQLYESLFASATSPCRKLHRLARSVIILDEAQTIPVEFLNATLAALRELVERYGCSVVLCTATQPALLKNAEFAIGIEPAAVRSIIADVPALHAMLKRVRVEHLGRLSDDALADRLAEEPAALCVVNTRPHAARLYRLLIERVGAQRCYHLSTFMCPQHRREKLAEVRERLKCGQPCRLVSTQLIEAGVDVDFPAVYRAPAGFDAVAQAAGRCNREGRLDVGRVYTFETDQPPPPGLLRDAAETARELAGLHADPLSPEAVEAYFRQLYWLKQDAWDRHEVMPCFDWQPRYEADLPFAFRKASAAYRLIRDEQASVLVPFNKEAQGIRSHFMGGGEANYRLLREAQPYMVGVRERTLLDLRQRAAVVEHAFSPTTAGLWLLWNEACYDPNVGLTISGQGLDAELLIG